MYDENYRLWYDTTFWKKNVNFSCEDKEGAEKSEGMQDKGWHRDLATHIEVEDGYSLKDIKKKTEDVEEKNDTEKHGVRWELLGHKQL